MTPSGRHTHIAANPNTTIERSAAEQMGVKFTVISLYEFQITLILSKTPYPVVITERRKTQKSFSRRKQIVDHSQIIGVRSILEPVRQIRTRKS